MKTPTIFAFGASGNFGRALVEELLPDHRTGRLKLVASARKLDSVAALERLGVLARQIDLNSAELDGLSAIVEALRGVDRVFLLTGYDHRMLAQSKAVIDAAKAAGVSHIVHLGANGSDDTTSAYSGWHRLVEAYIEKSGIGFTHLRPCQTFQTLPMMNAISGMPGVIENYAGDVRVAWVDARDVAAVAAAVLRDPALHVGRAYPLATMQASLPEVVDLLAEVSGRPWRSAAEQPAVFSAKVASGGADPIYMGSVAVSFEKQRRGLLPILSQTYDNIEQLTGRPPRTLRSFLEQHLDLFKS